MVVFTSDEICESVTCDGAKVGMVGGQPGSRGEAVGSNNILELNIKRIWI